MAFYNLTTLTAGLLQIISKKLGIFGIFCIQRNILPSFLHIHTNYWAFLALSHRSTALEVADGVLDDVGPRHIWLKWAQKQRELMPHGLTKKRPTNYLNFFLKFQRKSFHLFFPPHVYARPEPVQQGRQQKKSSLK